jgi:hypothetical protein
MPRTLTEDERTLLEDATPFVALTQCDGWPQLLALMDGIVERADHALKLNQSSQMDTVLRQVWQQRNFMREAVLDHINDLLERRREILEDINKEPTEVNW